MRVYNRVCVYLVSVSAEVEESRGRASLSCRSRRLCLNISGDAGTRRRDGHRVIVVCLKRRKEGEIGAPAERKSTNRRLRREAAVEAEVGEAAVRSDGFVFLHNGGAKRPQTVGLWGVFPSSPRDVLPCKFLYVSLLSGGRK